MPKEEEDEKRVFAVDCDGFLCEEECWTEAEVLTASPRLEVIEKVNKLYRTEFVVIYTARQDHLIPATLEWLRRNNVRFHAISNFKMGADVYLDDRAISYLEFLRRRL